MLRELLLEITNDLLEKEIINEIDNSINEELSISNQLKNEANRIIDEVKFSIKNTPTLPFNIKNVSYKTNKITTNFNGDDINIIYYYYNFFYEDDYNKNKRHIDNITKNVYKDKTIYVTILAISGGLLLNTFQDSIYHELEHMYQQKMMNKDFGFNKIYKIGLLLKKSNIYEDYVIGNSIYLSRDFEQDAYVNGLYALLINACDSQLKIMNILKKSDAYNALYSLKKNLNYIINNEKKIKAQIKMYNGFGLTYNNIIVIIKKAIKRFENKIGKVVIKVRNEIIEKYGYGFLEHFKYTNPLDEPIFAKDIEPIM